VEIANLRCIREFYPFIESGRAESCVARKRLKIVKTLKVYWEGGNGF